MAEWQLRFDASMVPSLANAYAYLDDSAVITIGRQARMAGAYSHSGFLAVCKWKSKRSQSRCKLNTPPEVEEITRLALSTKNERLKIGALRCLQGVDWPTASVLLHLAHPDPYPILDFRACWSWGFDKQPVYTFEFWWRYVEACRSLAERSNVDMRTLDRALWQYSSENQAASTAPDPVVAPPRPPRPPPRR